MILKYVWQLQPYDKTRNKKQIQQNYHSSEQI